MNYLDELENTSIRILREAERGEQTIGEICRGHGVSKQFFMGLWPTH